MGHETWVVNASPLIALAKVGQLQLLERTGQQLLIPEAVRGEVAAGGDMDPARAALQEGFGGAAVAAIPDPDVLEWGLGKGETAVLTLARAHGAVAILDDAEARAAARAFGIRMMGTLGVVLLARRDERIASATQVLRALRRAGLHLDEALLRDALPRVVGETWEP